MSVDKHLKSLTLIAKVFNKNSVKWALGGSLLLYLKGLTEEVNDIDIMVFDEDVSKADLILSKLGKRLPVKTSELFKTKYFFKYDIQGIEVDLMAHFIIVKDDLEYHFPLKKTSIEDVIKINEQTVYLQRLADWQIFYDLMGRKKRVEEIKKRSIKI